MRVAIIGTGVSGLSALWVSQLSSSHESDELTRQLLNEYSEHEVNIYEKNDYPGGHTNTAVFRRKVSFTHLVLTHRRWQGDLYRRYVSHVPASQESVLTRSGFVSVVRRVMTYHRSYLTRLPIQTS